MRTILVLRHAHSTANVTEVPSTITAEDLAFANKSAGLTKRGEDESDKLAIVIPLKYGIHTDSAHVAVSEFKRTQQTAKRLGFQDDLITSYPELNEVEHDMALGTLRTMLRQNQIPPVALRTADATLQQSPKEGIWVTHGLLIAGLCAVLGTIDKYERAVPRQCEVRWLTF